MLDDTFNLLKKTSVELNLPQDVEKLDQMYDIYNKKEYFVTFIGQFSAGKSYLINNLLERKLLPQGTTETTPLLTYIRYNDEINDLVECAVIHFKDANDKKISLEDVTSIIQKSDNVEWNIENIDYLEVYLSEDILKNGMILLDTPGINTIIERHEKLLANSLLLSSKIIYVSGHSPSQVDVDKINMFIQQGFNISFVRTHCDEIKSSEETVEQVIDTDLKILEKCGLKKDDCYFVSNINNSLWFKEIAKIRQILVDIGNNVEILLEEDTNAQLMAMAQNYIVELEKVKKILQEKDNNEKVVLEERKKQINKKIETLENVVKIRQNELQNKLKEIKLNVRREATTYAQKAIEKSASNIMDSGDNVVNEKSMSLLIDKEKQQFLQNLFIVINTQIDPVLTQINGKLDLDFDLPNTDLPDIKHYQELMNYQDNEIEEMKNELQRLREEIKKIDFADSEEINEDALIELQNELIAIKREYEKVTNQPVKKIEVQDNSSSEIGKQIGKILDIALLVAPIPSTGKMATVAKVGFLGKMKNAIIGFLGTEKKVPKITKMQRFKQVALQTASVLKNAKTNEEFSCFDMLSAEYWGQKIGESFNGPPKLVVDEAYEKERQDKKEELRKEILDKQQNVYKLRQKMNIFKNENDRKIAEKNSLIVNEQQLISELKSRERQIQKEARKKALKKWKIEYAQWYTRIMKEQIDLLLDNYLKDLPERLSDYQDKRLISVQEKLQQEKNNYEQLMKLPESEVYKKLECVNNLIVELRQCCAL